MSELSGPARPDKMDIDVRLYFHFLKAVAASECFSECFNGHGL